MKRLTSVLQLCTFSDYKLHRTRPDTSQTEAGMTESRVIPAFVLVTFHQQRLQPTQAMRATRKKKQNTTACVFDVAECSSDAVGIYKFAALMRRDGPPHAWRLMSHQGDESEKLDKLLRCLASLRAWWKTERGEGRHWTWLWNVKQQTKTTK